MSLGVTGRKEKGLTVMYLLLIFFMLGWFLYLLDHLTNPRDDAMD